jgi:hypothetical protein
VDAITSVRLLWQLLVASGSRMVSGEDLVGVGANISVGLLWQLLGTRESHSVRGDIVVHEVVKTERP